MSGIFNDCDCDPASSINDVHMQVLKNPGEVKIFSIACFELWQLIILRYITPSFYGTTN